MASRITRVFAATVIALGLGAFAAPAASAQEATPVTGSVIICLPVGSAAICL